LPLEAKKFAAAKYQIKTFQSAYRISSKRTQGAHASPIALGNQ